MNSLRVLKLYEAPVPFSFSRGESLSRRRLSINIHMMCSVRIIAELSVNMRHDEPQFARAMSNGESLSLCSITCTLLIARDL